jgi:hypothetical protein
MAPFAKKLVFSPSTPTLPTWCPLRLERALRVEHDLLPVLAFDATMT